MKICSNVDQASKNQGGFAKLSNSIFEEPWWLDAVAPGSWKELLVVRDDEVIARMAFAYIQRAGLRLLTNPPLTQTLGPWLRRSKVKYTTKLAEEKELLNTIIHKLPPADLIGLTLPHGITNILPFYWNGFTSEVRFTYRIEPLHDLDLIWRGFTDKCRNTIRKAEKTMIVNEGLCIEQFYNIIRKTWERQNMAPNFSFELLKRLHSVCKEKNAVRVFYAEDAKSNIHAVHYFVWDERAGYYLIGGADPSLRNSGAQNLLVWHAIKFASTVTNAFDFEGSANEQIEHSFRSFGAVQCPLFHIRKISRKMAAMTGFKDIIQAVVGRRLKWFY